MTLPRIRVAIVDDHPALREGTATLLAREPDLEVVGVVGSLAEAVELSAEPAVVHVLVVDIKLGEERGLELLTAQGPGRARPAIVIWTAYDYPQYAAYAYRAGAAGFVLKTAPTSELVSAIRAAAAGAVHFASRPHLDGRHLTEREHQVLARLVDGLSNDEIAARLQVTTRTVEAHLTRLYERFGAHSRTELVARTVREGWLDVPPGAEHHA